MKIKNILNKVSKAKVPRPLSDIQQEYSTLMGDAAKTQYQIYVLEEALKKLNERLKEVNQEGAARQDLDKNSAKEQPEKER